MGVDYYFNKDAPAIPIPVELTGPKGSIVVHAVLTTGSTYCMVPPEIVASIGLNPAKPDKHALIVHQNGTLNAPIVRIPTVTVLGRKATDIAVACASPPEESRICVALGLSFLRHFRVVLDHQMGQFQLLESEV